MNSKQNIIYITVITLCLCGSMAAYAYTPMDSIRIENQAGKKVIVHLIEAKETYYSLGRKYGVAPKTIMAYNKNRTLKINDLVKIPTEQPYTTVQATQKPTPIPPSPIPQQQGVTKYKVGKGETLYSIAKRFQVSEEQIMAANGMTNKSLKMDQILQIPQKPVPSAPITEPEPILTETGEEEPVIAEDRYGIRQMSERGIGIWLEGLNADGGKMLALHKTAPVGTVVKITNPMTQRSTFAKVVGKYTDTSQTQDAIIVISKAAADQIGIIDKRFLVNISYGIPEN